MSTDSIVTLIGTIVTIASTVYTIRQARKAKGYKDKTKRLYYALDKNMLAERSSQLSSEICNIPGCQNNNKGGKCSSLFNRVNLLMSDIQKFALRNNVLTSSTILSVKEEITTYIILNRDTPTIDVVYLSGKMNELDILIQRLCGDGLNDVEL